MSCIGVSLSGSLEDAGGGVVGGLGVLGQVEAGLLDVTIGIRVSEDAESTGLDLDQHGETAYHEADVLMSRVLDGATALAGSTPKEREKVS
jgi:hypothetical protein